ncbi:MAG: response regulator transcription factor [Bacteroidia bacterium]|nr:response regulator transcription factor [Bacteroidia bacterium]
MGKIRIFLVDDHQIMIDGLKALLRFEKEIEIIGESTRPLEAVQTIQQLKPDLVITDISMPLLDGIGLTKTVKSNHPDVKVLALSMSGERVTISEMLDAGVSGYILKNTGKDELVGAIHKIIQGGMFFSDQVSAELMKAIQERQHLKQDEEKAGLTQRELEIIRLIAKEYSNLQIADALFISERTVESHRKNIFRKTETKTIVGLIKYAIEHKLVD